MLTVNRASATIYWTKAPDSPPALLISALLGAKDCNTLHLELEPGDATKYRLSFVPDLGGGPLEPLWFVVNQTHEEVWHENHLHHDPNINAWTRALILELLFQWRRCKGQPECVATELHEGYQAWAFYDLDNRRLIGPEEDDA